MRNYWLEITTNQTLWVAVSAFAAAQLIKILIELYKTKKLNLSLLIGSGGMPSSHSAFVAAVSVSIGMKEGFNSTMFAVAAIFSIVVMYDASGVRRAAGKQASVLNQILNNIENHGVIIDRKLKELLGHSPKEVLAGALLGGAMAVAVSSLTQ